MGGVLNMDELCEMFRIFDWQKIEEELFNLNFANII